ncbi:hypothetical protein R1flu_025621 [Riccia fluitans]|uniref:Uncharacterized protein n=1 Tax=Riccia fluitans TaxID=41844 RepID=A0ABD1XYB5_9MARC
MCWSRANQTCRDRGMNRWDVWEYHMLRGQSLGDAGCALVHRISWAGVPYGREGATPFDESAAWGHGILPGPCYPNHFPKLSDYPSRGIDLEGILA